MHHNVTEIQFMDDSFFFTKLNNMLDNETLKTKPFLFGKSLN